MIRSYLLPISSLLAVLTSCSAAPSDAGSNTAPIWDSASAEEISNPSDIQAPSSSGSTGEMESESGDELFEAGTPEAPLEPLPLSMTPESSSMAGSPQNPAETTKDPDFPLATCEDLATDPAINWRESSLQTDQSIVECLARTLGRPVGFGENARGGYDPAGGSRLVVITLSAERTVEEQVLQAISGDEPAWIVFDKLEFAAPFEVGMYRLGCSDPAVLSQIEGSEAECRDYRLWCAARSLEGEAECLERFFNQSLNEGELPIRNPIIGSNKTLDGRMSEAFFRFSGFSIGSDNSGQPVSTAEHVIVTHLRFLGAGHTEDHELDPDMLRSTGASHDIWIHKNEFNLTGDSAFDVKVGAHNVTISFNRVVDVKRATLHGSSDSREINQQITTSIHHNAFVTTDKNYFEFGNTARRVPLIRRGTAHLWNNLLVNYRKDVLSIRVGAQVQWENNLFLVNAIHQEKDSLADSLTELGENLIRDVDRGNFRSSGSRLWFSDASCILDPATETPVDVSFGEVAELTQQYDSNSRQAFAAQISLTGQNLVDYVSATAGKYGAVPFNSPLAATREQVLSAPRTACQQN